jgi:hypothetical protein
MEPQSDPISISARSRRSWLAILLPSLLTAVSSCATPRVSGPGVEAALAKRPDALFQLRRRGCEEGSCPVFGVAIYTDGAVVFDGGVNVKAVGQRKGELAGAKVASLLDAFHKVDFIDTPERCCECPNTTRTSRTPQLVIDYRPGSVEKEIVMDEGCADVPQGIRGLVDEIEGLALVSAWIGSPSRPVGYDGAAETRL